MTSRLHLRRTAWALALVVAGVSLSWILSRSSRGATDANFKEPKADSRPIMTGHPGGREVLDPLPAVAAVGVAAEALSPELESLLADASRPVRMRDVPRLGPQTEQVLVRRLATTEGITNRYRILRILILGHSHAALPLVEVEVTRAHAGKDVTLQEEANLLHLPTLLGILAAEDDNSLQWLLRGAQIGFWEEAPLWARLGSDPVPLWSLRGACIAGLGRSGRPEARDFFEALRSHPDRAVELGVIGALVDAAFEADQIAQYGLQAAMDDRLPSRNRHNFFVEWRHSTAAGLAWGEWAMEARRKEASRLKP